MARFAARGGGGPGATAFAVLRLDSMRGLAVQLLCGPLLASCGALMQPGPFLLPVESRPSGATVVYEGREVGVTPCTVPMKRGASRIELRRDGYLAQPVDVGRVKNPWVACNVLTFGLGMYVDHALGAAWRPDTRHLEVVLAKGVGPTRPTWVRVESGGEIWNGESPQLHRRPPGDANRARDAAAEAAGSFLALLVRAAIESLAR